MSSTGRTLDQIFNEIAAVRDNDCGTRVPGVSRSDGSAEVTLAGTTPTILIESYRHEFQRTVDSGGNPMGAMVQGPLIVTKNLDRNTPILADALNRNATMPLLVLRLRDGMRANYFNITLGDAIVQRQSTGMVARCDGTLAHLEELAIVYQTITWEDVASQTKATVSR